METPPPAVLDTAQPTSKKSRGIWKYLMVLALILIAVSARLVWITATVVDDKAGGSRHQLTGVAWAPIVLAGQIVLAMGFILLIVFKFQFRKILGTICAGASLGLLWSPLQLLFSGVDLERVQILLLSGVASQKSNAPITISQWATVSGAEVHKLALLLACLGSLCAFLAAMGAILQKPAGIGQKTVQQGAKDISATSKYQRATHKKERLNKALEEYPESEDVMWDALDADMDPTDYQGRG
ncbi:Trp biosynthesis-associated membrane protein [Corynebacterium caspium]|uniref:Trp biosynthesis-associated membrane protein n=1 Tax=Corynebacterium caspium TaxID=234828 RepID=UPI0003775C51|nr:Trp biosynthesis-associated membrane protein [Corynebacterium caspium]WKD59032.1 Tryptophan-associated transmembrane protein [Corynebacterium caspium DSM 44850]